MLGAIIGGLGGLASGLFGASEAEKQRKYEMERNAIQTQYSPWLAPNYQQVSAPKSALGMGLGGAFSGAMTGSQIGAQLSGTPDVTKFEPVKSSSSGPSLGNYQFSLDPALQKDVASMGTAPMMGQMAMSQSPYQKPSLMGGNMRFQPIQAPWGR